MAVRTQPSQEHSIPLVAPGPVDVAAVRHATNEYRPVLQNLQGYQDVTGGQAASISGLRALDDQTLVAKLTTAGGWFPTVIGQWPGVRRGP